MVYCTFNLNLLIYQLFELLRSYIKFSAICSLAEEFFHPFELRAGISKLYGRDKNASRIIGGQNAEQGEYPWVAALYRNGKFRCTFSILSESWLLGAAHCLVDITGKVYPIRTFTAIVGHVNRSSSAINVTFSSIITHRKYESFRAKNDIALCKLSKPLTFDDNIKPICIPSSGKDFVGKSALAMGWGSTRRVGHRIPQLLQVVKVDIASHGWCSFIYWLAGFGTIYLSKNQLCAGSLMVGVCNGDSGGPLILDEGERNVTVGITSFGTWAGCAPLGIPAVYTAVSQYVEWIKEKIDEDFCIVD